MSYKEEVVDCIKKSLKDVRCCGTILSLEKLMVRKEKDIADHYRFIKEDDTPIKTIDELIAMIDVNECTFLEVSGTGDRFTGTYQAVRVVLENVYVYLQESNMLDRLVMANNFMWSLAKPSFTLEYRNDNDKDLPLKIAYMNLYSAKGAKDV